MYKHLILHLHLQLAPTPGPVPTSGLITTHACSSKPAPATSHSPSLAPAPIPAPAPASAPTPAPGTATVLAPPTVPAGTWIAWTQLSVVSMAVPTSARVEVLWREMAWSHRYQGHTLFDDWDGEDDCDDGEDDCDDGEYDCDDGMDYDDNDNPSLPRRALAVLESPSPLRLPSHPGPRQPASQTPQSPPSSSNHWSNNSHRASHR